MRRKLTNGRSSFADRIGEMIEFTFDELKELAEQGYSIRHVKPCDASDAQVAAFWKEHRKKRERIRKQTERAKEAPMMTDQHLPQRTKAVKRALTRNWQPRTAIDQRLAPSFPRVRSDGARGVVVGREIKKLGALGVAEQKIEPGKRGLPTAFVRLSQ